MRTFADWNDPSPGSMEMDLVAHCGSVNRGSYVHSLLTDIASGGPKLRPSSFGKAVWWSRRSSAFAPVYRSPRALVLAPE